MTGVECAVVECDVAVITDKCGCCVYGCVVADVECALALVLVVAYV